MSLTEVQEQIRHIKSLDIKPDNLDVIKEQVKRLPLPVPVTVLKKDFYVYRARYIDSDFPGHKREVSYPYETRFVKSFGRCNFPEQQIFYGSVLSDKIQETRVTGISEIIDFDSLDRNKRHFIAVGKWLILEDIFLAELYLRDERIKNKITENANTHHKNQLGTLEADVRQVHEEILTFFSDELTEPKGRYELTSTISNLYFNKYFKKKDGTESFTVEGLSYPSVKTEGEGMNVALLPTAIEKLKLEMVLINEIVFTGPKSFYFHNYEMSIDISADGKITKYQPCPTKP